MTKRLFNFYKSKAFAVLLLTISMPALTTHAWPMFMHDAQHTGRSSLAVNARPQLLWQRDFNLSIKAAPAVDSNGRLYFGSLDHNLYALSSRGNTLWSFPTQGEIQETPALGQDGTVYFGSADHLFYAVRSDGTLRWQYDLGSQTTASPTIVYQGQSEATIYVPTTAGTVFAFSENGSLQWSTPPLDYGLDFSSPAVNSQQQIAIGSLGHPVAWSSGLLHLLNEDGSPRCSYDTGFFQGNGIRSSISIMPNDNMVFSTVDNWAWGQGKLYIINQSCQRVCRSGDIDHNQSSPALGADNTIYLGLAQGLRAMNQSCQTLWTASVGPVSFSTPAIDRQGIIYLGADDGRLSAVRPDGTIRWQFQLNEQLGSPVIGTGGQLYVVSASHLYAFGGLLFYDVMF